MAELLGIIVLFTKCQRIPKGQLKMDNPEKLATPGTQDEDKQNTNNMCRTPPHTNNVNKTRNLQQPEVKTNRRLF